MFEQATLSNANVSRRAWTTGLGFFGEAALVGFIALVPIIWPEVMPKPQALLMLLTPPAPSPVKAVRPQATRTIFKPHLFTMPTIVPATITNIVDDPPEVAGAVLGAGHTAGDPTGLLTAILGALESTSWLPAVVSHPGPKSNTAVEPSVPKRIRTSSLELARLVHRVEPVYPSIAKLAHVSGIVELTAVVGTDGRIRELKALSGNPLLIRAAIDAVSQWIYAPPILNGERVEVIAPVTVNFRLDR